jgi:hypothetical protein
METMPGGGFRACNRLVLSRAAAVLSVLPRWGTSAGNLRPTAAP